MRYFTIIRSLCLMLLGITAYSTLLWVTGWRIPGRLRKHNRQIDYGRKKIWTVLVYNALLAFLIILSLMFIKYMVRGAL